MAGLRAPLPTLRRRPRERRRTARGQCGSLLLHRSGLSPPTPRQSPGAHAIRATICLQEIRSDLILPRMNAPAPPRGAGPRSRPGASQRPGPREKFCPSIIAHNPLKTLDSDERIQGNPRLIIEGLCSETARRQENPNRGEPAKSRDPSPRRSEAHSIRRQERPTRPTNR